MKQTFLLLLLLFAGHNALAQDSTIQYRSLRVILKLAPLSLLDPDMTVQGGVEVRVSPRNSVQVEAGFGLVKAMQPYDTDLIRRVSWIGLKSGAVRSEYGGTIRGHYRTNTCARSITYPKPVSAGKLLGH